MIAHIFCNAIVLDGTKSFRSENAMSDVYTATIMPTEVDKNDCRCGTPVICGCT